MNNKIFTSSLKRKDGISWIRDLGLRESKFDYLSLTKINVLDEKSREKYSKLSYIIYRLFLTNKKKTILENMLQRELDKL